MSRADVEARQRRSAAPKERNSEGAKEHKSERAPEPNQSFALAASSRDNNIVAYLSTELVNQARFDAGVNRAARALSEDVVHIYYDVGSDWIGNPAVFFNVVLKDRSSKPPKLREVAQRVALRIMNEAKTDQSGLSAYFNFRSRSEHEKLKDPAWA